MFSYSIAPEGTSGFAAISDRFVALVAGAESVAVSELYAFMSGPDATIDDLLDAVSSYGIHNFAIVELLSASPVAVAIAASGSARVDIDGAASTTIAGPPGATWVIGKAREIRSLVMSLGGELGGELDAPVRFPIARGVVHAGSILIDKPSTEATARKAPQHPATMPITLPHIDPLTGIASAPETEPVVAPALSSEADDSPADDSLVMLLPDGNRLDPSTPVLIGRRPWSNATEDAMRFHVTALSPQRQISTRHVLLDSSRGSITAHDLNSTNGTIVLRFGRPPWLLHDGHSTVVHAGDVLDLGEGYRVTIVRA